LLRMGEAAEDGAVGGAAGGAAAAHAGGAAGDIAGVRHLHVWVDGRAEGHHGGGRRAAGAQRNCVEVGPTDRVVQFSPASFGAAVLRGRAGARHRAPLPHVAAGASVRARGAGGVCGGCVGSRSATRPWARRSRGYCAGARWWRWHVYGPTGDTAYSRGFLRVRASLAGKRTAPIGGPIASSTAHHCGPGERRAVPGGGCRASCCARATAWSGAARTGRRGRRSVS